MAPILESAQLRITSKAAHLETEIGMQCNYFAMQIKNDYPQVSVKRIY